MNSSWSSSSIAEEQAVVPVSSTDVRIPKATNLNQLSSKELFIPLQGQLTPVWHDYKIDLEMDIKEAPICLEVVNDRSTSTVGTLGNFSVITGKAKSKKSFFISLIVAAALRSDGNNGRVISCLPSNKRKVILIDTEQSDYHVKRVIERVHDLAGHFDKDHFEAYALRKCSTAERLKYVEDIIKSKPDLGLLVIDGIRDLITDINDVKEANMIVSKLMQWSEANNIHIIVVLHQNKNDLNARGHLGTEINNKAETVISVSVDPKNKNISTVAGTYCRDRGFDDFAISVDESTALPYFVENYKKATENKKVFTPSDIEENTHLQVLKNVFSIKEGYKYKELQTQLIFFFGEVGKRFGLNKSRDFVTYYLNNGLIKKEEKKGVRPEMYTFVNLC